MEVSPNRVPKSDPSGSRSVPRERSEEKRLNRPLSLPLDPKVCIVDRSGRPIRGYKEKQSDDSSPEIHRRADYRNEDFK